MMAAIIRPMQIASSLNDKEDAVSVSNRDLYSFIARTSRIQRHGLQASDALVANLERDQANGEIYSRYYLNPSCQFNMVYFAVRSAVQYAQRHHEILILDCTYKTIKYYMPLLPCVGVDQYGHSFAIALCFLDRETQENCDRALQWLIETVYTHEEAIAWPSVVVTDCEVAFVKVIHRRFPATSTKRILCRWHIMMNVRSRHNASFPTEERWKEFKMAVNSNMLAKTFDEYLDAVQGLENEFHYREDHLLLRPDRNAVVSIEVRLAESSTAHAFWVSSLGHKKNTSFRPGSIDFSIVEVPPLPKLKEITDS